MVSSALSKISEQRNTLLRPNSQMFRQIQNTNALAYYDGALMTREKRFIGLAPAKSCRPSGGP
jgi:hypothetical protein